MSRIGVALVGYGTIGSGVIEILQNEQELIRKRTGLDIELLYVADKDLTTPRRVAVKSAKMVSDYREVLKDPDVNIVIELVGGVGFANTLVEDCLKSGKNVVTANKALLAEKGAPLFRLAKENGLAIGFEASVCGGIPIIRIITDALAGDRIHSIHGIVNGTTNYILTKMYEENLDFDTALKQAQKLGFAEADPTLDIGGGDAAHKITILAGIAFNTAVGYAQVSAEGITGIDLADVKNAREFGYVLKLLAIAKCDPDGTVEVRVSPTLVPLDNQLANVRNEFNAVLINSEYLTNSMYFGRGAGSRPTASAVVADIVDIAKFKDAAHRTSKFIQFNEFPVKSMGEIESRYYVRFNVFDQPGVLSKISGIFGKYNISIASVIQEERSENDYVPLLMTTHSAKEKNMIAALDEIQKLDFCRQRGVLIRII
jgi:homoserine dehydrogenase